MAFTDTFERRLWAKVEQTDGCWLWRAGTSGPPGNEYGSIRKGAAGAGKVKAHRAVYELLVGPIPEGKELHHLCGERLCVRPDHLLPVTRREPLSGGNLAVYGRRRQCRQCFRDRGRARRGGQ